MAESILSVKEKVSSIAISNSYSVREAIDVSSIQKDVNDKRNIFVFAERSNMNFIDFVEMSETISIGIMCEIDWKDASLFMAQTSLLRNTYNLNVFLASTEDQCIQLTEKLTTEVTSFLLVVSTRILYCYSSFFSLKVSPEYNPIEYYGNMNANKLVLCTGDSFLAVRSLAEAAAYGVIGIIDINSIQDIVDSLKDKSVVVTDAFLYDCLAMAITARRGTTADISIAQVNLLLDTSYPRTKSDIKALLEGNLCAETSAEFLACKEYDDLEKVKNDLIKQVVAYSVSSEFVFSIERTQKPLSFSYQRYTEKHGSFLKQNIFVGVLENNCNFGVPVVNADFICIEDFDDLCFEDGLMNSILSHTCSKAEFLVASKQSSFVQDWFDNYRGYFGSLGVTLVVFDPEEVESCEILLWRITLNGNLNYLAEFKSVSADKIAEKVKIKVYAESIEKASIVLNPPMHFELVREYSPISLLSLYETLLAKMNTKGSNTTLIMNSFGGIRQHLGMSLVRGIRDNNTWLLYDSSRDSEADIISAVHSILRSSVQKLRVLFVTSQKKQSLALGLFCMNYGSCFVASVDALSNKEQALHALLQASRYEGVSVVVARADPCSSKFWSSYRWNPQADEERKFELDSDDVAKQISKFLERDEQLSLMASKSFKFPTSLDVSVESQYEKVEKKLKQQFEALNQKLTQQEEESKVDESDSFALLILYGSDSGNGQSVAEKLASKASASAKSKEPGFNKVKKLRVCEANDYESIEEFVDFDFSSAELEDPSIIKVEAKDNSKESIFADEDEETPAVELSQETESEGSLKLVVVFVLSTAGQGEPTLNAKTLSESILGTKSPSSLMKHVRYGMFGLGDSHYWGKGTQESDLYFCKIAKDVDTKLESLAAVRVCTSYYGDDQDDDGYNTKLELFERELWSSLHLDVPQVAATSAPEIVDDILKAETNFLRGTIDEGLRDHTTLKMLPEDTKLTKFHGIYQQDLRSVREELDAKQMERAYSFMIRIGIPGGVCGVGQFLDMLDICENYANQKLKLTTRQAFQIHGVVKKELKKTMQEINKACMDTLAACGDVNRNVIANPYLHLSKTHALVNKLAHALNKHLKPRTSAYHEIWLDKKPVFSTKVEEEPIYGKTYLPRKFKIAIAVPPLNDVDVFAHCLGFIAINNAAGELEGFNISVGGGMGTTHNNPLTYPKLSELLGFYPCTGEKDLGDLVAIAEAVVILQRDNGDRVNRKHARLKYTVEDKGVKFFQDNVERIARVNLERARPFKFERNADDFGWKRSALTNKWTYTMFVENGYILDTEERKLKSSLRSIAQYLQKYIADAVDSSLSKEEVSCLVQDVPNFSMTANQNLIFGEIDDSLKPQLEQMFIDHGLSNADKEIRLHSMACVALPTCALAMAESQRYLPSLLIKIEKILDKCGIPDSEIVIRMTGCPNGCARPYMAEIAFVGKAPGQYNMYLGGGYAGNRLNKLYREGVDESQILEILEGLLERYAKTKTSKEHFGDWCIRMKVIEPTLDGKYFWKTGDENLLHDKLQVYW